MNKKSDYLVAFIGFGVVSIFQRAPYWNIILITVLSVIFNIVVSKKLNDTEKSEGVKNPDNESEPHTDVAKFNILFLISGLGLLAGSFIRFEILGWP